MSQFSLSRPALFVFVAGCLSTGTVRPPFLMSQSPSDVKFTFDVALIKPSAPMWTAEDWDSDGSLITIRGYSLRKLVQAAYGLGNEEQVVGGPGWSSSKRFDVKARIAPEDLRRWSESGRGLPTLIQVLLQRFLVDRFGLRAKAVNKRLPVFMLTLSRTSPRMMSDMVNSPSLHSKQGHLEAIATSMEEFAGCLALTREVVHRPVVNRTNLDGRFDFTLIWTPERDPGMPSSDSASPELFTAIREQLGLALKPGNADVAVISIEEAQLPDFD